MYTVPIFRIIPHHTAARYGITYGLYSLHHCIKTIS